VDHELAYINLFNLNLMNRQGKHQTCKPNQKKIKFKIW